MIEADLVVIGAGPAGMSAARQAVEAGLSVVLLDEQKRAGGQIYRNVAHVSPARADILGPDVTRGGQLVAAIQHPRITHIAGASVWQIEGGTRVAYCVNGVAAVASGKRLLIATGAIERPMPVPGWTLPGVMNAGAAQILVKQSGMVLENAVLAGCGPLLYLVAAQMCRAGSPPLALVETQSTADLLSALRHWPGALRGWRHLVKGLGLLAEIRKAGVKRYSGASAIAVDGADHAEAIRFTVRGRQHCLSCETVLLHHGVVPNTQTARSIGVPHEWQARQRAFVPTRDEWGRSPQNGVFIAGDGAGIGGALAAELAGAISALQIAGDLDALTPAQRDAAARPLRRALRGELALRPFLDRAYPPYQGALSPADETVVCRCEEVTAGEIRKFAKLGCLGPNQAKAFGRQGMGPCQGRYCGLTVTELLAAENGQSPDVTGYYRIRPPIKPVTLGELASMPATGWQPNGKQENDREN
ncbi:MAG: FAD/NAD(P)-binding oxidoreductase [Antarcticimicrobium sp.]|uniref:FAD/NAD(P)-dependent oxidoreductase n=1 Tax=Antarcticimicrobium sp. TaxID=2824147 RepID=UPI0026392C29|nr:FAD/NAD(P)-binding oxidoreductase [Antarcticimicrobium sp.]MDF1715969.1 FAD/NAD(P)-binding oxidoreductase [Antarcticimicrobium sp.]